MTTERTSPARTPLVSVLVPIYNVERYLDQCLASLAAQTLTDIEIICINDGSTDGSREIIQRHLDADGRFRVIDKPNSGYGASMNQGLDAARGEYVTIVESDDFLDPEGIETMYRVAVHTGVDVVKCDFYLHWSEPEEKSVRFGFTDDERSGLVDPRECLDLFYLKSSIWSALYRRRFLMDNGIRFMETPGASFQDTSFNFKVFACARSVFLIDAAYLHYRQDNETSSVNSLGKVHCVCDEYDEMVRFVGEHPDGGETLLPVLCRMRFDAYMWNYERLADDLRHDWALQMARDFRAEDAAGIFDEDHFEHWKVCERSLITEDPERFYRLKEQRMRYGRLGSVGYFIGIGGLPLLGYMLGFKSGLVRIDPR